MKPKTSGSYIDQKDRLRWHCNDQLADNLKQLYDFLIIGNYEESHASRYPRLAHIISRHPESVEAMKAEGRLSELPGVSATISGIIEELMVSGSCKKMEEGDEFFSPPPRSVLELTEIPRLGAKTAKLLFQEHNIDGLESLEEALYDGRLELVKGIGERMIETIKRHIQSKRKV